MAYINDDYVLDLSNCGLTTLPQLPNKQIIKFMYLQNNQLEELPENFFSIYPCLVWLDLRDNYLKQIPISIQDHGCLETLLLQNNQLTSLPNELGTVASLKTLQLKGNIIEYPNKKVLDGGTLSVVNFLRTKYEQQQNVNDVNELGYESEVDTITGSDIQPKYYIKIFGSKTSNTESKVVTKSKKLAKSRSKYIPNVYNTAKYLKPLRAASKEEQTKKIYDRLEKDKALKKCKEMISLREKKLQEIKTREHLKNWKKCYHTVQYQMQNIRGPTYKLHPEALPYDTDPNYYQMMTREELSQQLPSRMKKHIKRRAKSQLSTGTELAKVIRNLFESLDETNQYRGDITPRTEQKMLSDEIAKITAIQEKLSVLNLKNDRSVNAL